MAFSAVDVGVGGEDVCQGFWGVWDVGVCHCEGRVGEGKRVSRVVMTINDLGNALTRSMKWQWGLLGRGNIMQRVERSARPIKQSNDVYKVRSTGGMDTLIIRSS